MVPHFPTSHAWARREALQPRRWPDGSGTWVHLVCGGVTALAAGALAVRRLRGRPQTGPR
ncbi:hypothetical protein FNH04_31435 [Streptomyces phyllanthi]|uniref:Uncharacterized protein n=1 Tax=Streptomyces phyllanthi TaxID=1803180 RepID=A0A5N8WCU0_9ACTN|nr:hypothetical protein [Streptomyces phyllanthi]